MKNKKDSLDYRKLSAKAKEDVRIMSVRRVIRKKESPEKVAKEYGYNTRNIYRWLEIYRKKGYAGLRAKKIKGRPLRLTKEEIRKLKYWLGKDPRQLKFPFGLWTVEMVLELVETKFGKQYAVSGMHRLLQSLGYSYQTPILKPLEQNPQAVQAWIEEEYPRIREEAKQEKRNIYFADESGFQSIHNKVKTWGKKGERPVIEHTGRRFSKGVISAITPQGKIRFMQYDGGMDQELFIEFLQRIEVNEQKKITLIVDGLPAHKGKKVREYIASTKKKIKLYFLPGYSPELNPDELVWSGAKRDVQRRIVKTKKELEKNIARYLHSIQKKKAHIQSLFKHPKVAYITGI